MGDDDYSLWTYPNRTFCDTLEEIRVTVKILGKRFDVKDRTVNHMLLLIEELQTYGNRMESALNDSKDIRSLHKERKKLKKECKKLEEKIQELKDKLPEGEDDE